MTETAESRSISAVPVCREDDTVREVIDLLRQNNYRVLDYIYVLGSKGRIKGVFSVRDLFLKNKEERGGNFMERKVIRARASDDQEKAAFLALRNDLKSVPVVDKRDCFIGAIPSHVILKILYREQKEDILRSVGIVGEGEFQGAWKLFSLRVPWLLVGLFGGVFAAQIVSFFESSLKEYFIVAAFVPLIVYMADAVGAQTQTLYIRSLVFPHFENRRYFLREVKVSVLLALFLGTALSLIGFFMFGETDIAAVLGVSLFLTISAAVLISVMIPFLFQRMKLDPALGSGPFATIVADITSLIIYFYVAIYLLDVL